MFDIKSFRKENNLTQVSISNLLGCKQSFISDIERGKRPLPKIYIDILFEKFGNEKVEPHFREDSHSYNHNTIENSVNEISIDYAIIQKLKAEISSLKERIDNRQVVIDRLTQELLECKDKYILLLEKKS